MQNGDIWLPIANYSFGHLATTYSDGVISFTRGSTSWQCASYFNSLTHTFSELEGKKIRVDFDYTITGSVGSNRGIVFAMNEWPTTSLSNMNNRKAFVSLPDCKEASGHFNYETILSEDTFTGGTTLHDPDNYIGAIMYLMAGSSVKGTIYNLKYEYQP